MKHTLILLRHAKSSWAEPGLRDFDRPLNERGRRDAPFMASCMKSAGISPDLIISSDALRALETAKIFTMELAVSEFRTEHRIYEAPAIQLLQVLNELNSDYRQVLIVGHNPGLSDLTAYLTGEDIAMPTCSYVVIDFKNMGWDEVSGETGDLVSFDFPKNHR